MGSQHLGSQHRCLVALAATAVALASILPARAQEFPTRPIRMIIGFPPGAANDAVGRIVATKLSERLGKQVVVDNRAGASGIVASEIVAASPPDGHTIMLISIAHTANPSLYKLRYDTEKAFTAIAQLGAGSFIMAVHPSVPARTMQELFDLMRANPGKLHMPHAGVGTFQHMSSFMLLSMAGVDAVMVPFKGGGPALIDLISGNTQFSLVSLALMSTHVQAGKLRALGVSAPQRVASHPALPAIAETVPGFSAENWWGVVGPAGMQQRVLDRLISEILAVQDTAELRELLAREGAWPVKRAGAPFARFLSEEIAKWAKIVNEGKIKVE